MTLPNKLTLARGVMALLTFASLWTLHPAGYAAAFALYIGATVTDWIDGYIARNTNAKSSFGALADPIADKVLVLGTLIACMRIRWLQIPGWAIFLMVVRELVIGGLRSLAAVQGKLLASARSGKLTMGFQCGFMITILLLLVLRDTLGLPLPAWMLGVPYVLTILSMIASWLSGVAYLRNNRRLLESSWGESPP